MFVQQWGLCIFFCVIGTFFVTMTYGALLASKKSGKHISGVPFFGGLCIAAGFLLSPVKWLALLGFADYGLWYVPYALLTGFVFSRFKKKEDDAQ